MRRGRWLVGAFLLLVVGTAVGGFLLRRAMEPTGGGKGYVRINAPTPRRDVLEDLERRGFIRSAAAADFAARLGGRSATVRVGTYRATGETGAWSNVLALGRPIVQMVRLPETNWAKRTANVLQKAEVCKAEEYLREVNHPQGRKTDFPLPETSLEGYLYPDTYDLPPLLGAKAVVGRQLEAFRKKVWEPLGHPADLERILKVASLVQLEAGRDDERPIIAGVIENRLKKKMRLQIDASILYGLGKWRRLTFRDYREVDSPYNLYRVGGLPPTPICSPTIASIKAAMAPASHNYLYYVALPNGSSLFAATYEEHKRNIEKRKVALKNES
ncbi:endolytic transglycosylase MltG [bacterium]|nr:MAG: endolytic transglycosylase MltG [bacterium]